MRDLRSDLEQIVGVWIFLRAPPPLSLSEDGHLQGWGNPDRLDEVPFGDEDFTNMFTVCAHGSKSA